MEASHAAFDDLDATIIRIDRLIAAQLDAILHHPRLRELEGRWRGLAWLAALWPPGSAVQLQLLAVGWAEIDADLSQSDDLRFTELHHKIFQEGLNTAGGTPFGLLLLDREISHRPNEDGIDGVAVLGKLAELAAVAFAPLVTAAAPALLLGDRRNDAGNFAALAAVDDPAAAFETPEFCIWRGLRGGDAARFVALVMPRILARPPWRDRDHHAPDFRYDEYAPTSADRVWMTACYAFAAVVARAMQRHGWPADIRGADPGRIGGGLVTALPKEPFRLSDTFSLHRPPLDVAIRESQERGGDDQPHGGLTDAGLLPLVPLPFGTDPAFCSSRSLHAAPAPPYRRDPPSADGAVASQINAVLCASRFAHAIKIRGRDMIGRFRRAEEIEAELRAWLLPFVNAGASATPALRARAPLVRAEVSVRDIEGQPGAFTCSLFLQPHFQLDTLNNEFRFETSIGAEAVVPVRPG